jgi:hypothetical protein
LGKILLSNFLTVFIVISVLTGFQAFAGKNVDTLIFCESDYDSSSKLFRGIDQALINLNQRLSADKVTINGYSENEMTITKPFNVSAPTVMKEKDISSVNICVTLTKGSSEQLPVCTIYCEEAHTMAHQCDPYHVKINGVTAVKIRDYEEAKSEVAKLKEKGICR